MNQIRSHNSTLLLSTEEDDFWIEKINPRNNTYFIDRHRSTTRFFNHEIERYMSGVSAHDLFPDQIYHQDEIQELINYGAFYIKAYRIFLKMRLFL